MKRFIIICAIVLMAAPVAAFAQAGSTSGTIGKQDKSISGSEVRVPAHARRAHVWRKHYVVVREPRAPRARRHYATARVHHILDRKESLPSTIRLDEHSWVGNFFISLHKISGNVYEGTWNHGFATKFTITNWTRGAVRMARKDYPVQGAVTGTYTGQRTGSSAGGQAAISNGVNVTWHASW